MCLPVPVPLPEVMPPPPRHPHFAVVDQGGLGVSSWVLLACTSRTRKSQPQLLMPEGAHMQSSSRTLEHDSCKGRVESVLSGDGTLVFPQGLLGG